MKINGSGMMELLLTSVTGLVDNQETMVLMKIVVLSGSILIGMMLAVTQTTYITFVKEKLLLTLNQEKIVEVVTALLHNLKPAKKRLKLKISLSQSLKVLS